MTRFAAALFLLSALPVAAHADTFTFNISGGAAGESGAGTLTATQFGSPGEFLITGLNVATQGVSVALLPAGGFNGNDDLLFLNGGSFLTTKGFSFSANDGQDSFLVDVFKDVSSASGYAALFKDEDGFTATIPLDNLSISQVSAATPEPSSLVLLATGIFGVAGMFYMGRRRTAQTAA